MSEPTPKRPRTDEEPKRPRRAKRVVSYEGCDDDRESSDDDDGAYSKRDPLHRIDPAANGFRWPAYTSLVEQVMAAADHAEDDGGGGGGRWAVGRTAAARAKALANVVREMLGDRAAFAQRPARIRLVAAAAGLVLMGRDALLECLSARADRAQQWEELNPDAAEIAEARLQHIDDTEHFDWAEDILMAADDYDRQLEIAQCFGDDYGC